MNVRRQSDGWRADIMLPGYGDFTEVEPLVRALLHILRWRPEETLYDKSVADMKKATTAFVAESREHALTGLGVLVDIGPEDDHIHVRVPITLVAVDREPANEGVLQQAVMDYLGITSANPDLQEALRKTAVMSSLLFGRRLVISAAGAHAQVIPKLLEDRPSTTTWIVDIGLTQ
ncbi:MAG: hypothetical protein HN964_04275 [Candidatus Jacksonbacteria bacterium]|nr:hypothetical protein [Candidatus Jacksonbacteria bacterium]MBT7008640.1 hypothetical protein [Candidatus Jacksonbacteria bacterium]